MDCCSQSKPLWNALVSDVDLVLSRANVNVKTYDKFARLKPKLIWFDPESFLIYLVRRGSGELSETGVTH